MNSISPSGRTDLARSNDVSAARTAYEQQSNSATKAQQRVGLEKRDNVMISQEARALATANESEDVAFAKLALRAAKPLDAARLTEIRTRLSDGFYSSGEVANAVAGSLTDELTAAVI